MSRMTVSRFKDRVMVVTGAAQGIGQRVAELAAAEGASLVLVDRADLIHDVVAGFCEQGVEAIAVQADLETWEGAAEVMAKTVAHFGRIDILINNVGGAINFKPFTEFSEAEIAAEVNRSLMPTLWCCRAVLPTMVAQGSGVIVNVSSVATRGIHRIPYSAAKGGVNALTESLAFEYADHGIRVTAAGIGGTEAPPRKISRGTPEPRNETERAWFDAHIDQTKQSCLMGRYGTLDEMAAPILFLASDDASYITGSVLPVGGGDQG
ncbi:MAG: benzoate diol dehydrogenase BenD [Pseudomonadota bacterium]